MKMLVFLSLVFGLCKYAGAEETFTYSQSMECYVKSYENRVFKFVDDDYFVGKPLKVAELKRTPDFVAFKVNGKMYLAPKKCFTANEAINEDVTFEAMAYEEKNEKKKERIRKVFTQREKKKNYLNLSTGMNFSKKNMPVSKDNQFYLQAGDSVESLPIQSVGNVNSSKHSNDLAFQLEYGALKSESVHWIVSLKKTGKKISEYQSVVFDVSGIPVVSRWNLDWQMSSVDLQTGYSYSFNLNDENELSIIGLVGLASVDAKYTGLVTFSGSTDTVSIPGDKFSGTGFVGTLGLKYQTYFSDSWSLQLRAAYEIITPIKFKLKGTENSETSVGFTSNSLFGGLYSNLGLAWHF